jgi:hypothetical protein
MLLSGAPKGSPLRVRVPVWLEGAEPLERERVKASLDGADTEIVSVHGPSDDLVILLVLDLVADLAAIEPAKDALVAEIEKLPPNAWVGVLRAQDGLKVAVDPNADRGRTAQAIRDVPASGFAGLLDTVELMGRIADSILIKSGTRVALFYVTDSTVHNYREDFANPVINSSDSHDLSRKFPERLIREKISKVANNVSQQQTPLFIVHLDYRNDRLNDAYQIGLKQLAESTGGVATFCRSRGEIPVSIGNTLKLIAAHYSITVRVPPDAPRNAQLNLAADGQAGLSYRQRLVLKER